MSAQSFLAKLGLRTATLGSLASLAFAFPLAEGSMDPAAHTDATRTGFFAARGGTPEIGVVVNGTETLSVRQTGVVVTGSVNVSSTVTTTGLVLTPVAANPGGATTIWSNSGAGNAINIGANPLVAGATGAVQFNSGSNFGGDAANFFWDNTLKALALGSGTASARLDIVGLDLSAAADGAVGGLYDHSVALAKNDANVRQFYSFRLRPTLNTGASNANTTLDILNVDTVVGTTTGLTTNLMNLAYGGVSKFKVDSAGVTTIVGVPYTWPVSQGAANSLVQNNGSGVLSWNVMSGDATLNGSGALTLASIITAGGPTGSGTVVPVITYDAKGRLTAVTTATITAAGVGAIGGSIANTQIAFGAPTVNTIQGSATFLNVGGQITIGTATPDATAALTIVGTTLNTQATGSVGAIVTNTSLTKNDTNTRTFYGSLLKPTLNTGAGNTNTTFNVLAVDTINTGTTGLTTYLLNLAYGGATQATIRSDGAFTAHAIQTLPNNKAILGTVDLGYPNQGGTVVISTGSANQAGDTNTIILGNGSVQTNNATQHIIAMGHDSNITTTTGYRFNNHTLGYYISVTDKDNTWTLGSGAANGSRLAPAGSNTINFGINSTVPTMWINGASGVGTYGQVIIGTGTADATATLTLAGATLSTAADQSIATLVAGATVTKNDTNVRQFYGAMYKPTFNTGASNANTTYNILNIDSVNTALTGLTVNLLNLAYGGVQQAVVDSTGKGTFNGGLVSSGVLTLSRNGSGTSDYTLGVTGTTVASASSSQIRIGNALVGANNGTNGGTYLGMNIPASGAGSSADLFNFQLAGVSTYKMTSTGAAYMTTFTDDAGQGQATLTVGSRSGALPAALTVDGTNDTGGVGCFLMRAQGLNGAAKVFNVRNIAHPTNFTFSLYSLGAMNWGTGDSPRDVQLSRPSVGTLQIDNNGVGSTGGDLLIYGKLLVRSNNGVTTVDTNSAATINGSVLNTNADLAVATLIGGGSLTKNDTNTRTFYDVLVKPTFNPGASNTNTTYNIIGVDTVNTTTTGTVINLMQLRFGNSQIFNIRGQNSGALVFGSNSTVSSSVSFGIAMGNQAQVNGTASTNVAIGDNVIAGGGGGSTNSWAFALGIRSTSSGNQAHSYGSFLTSSGFSSFTVGSGISDPSRLVNTTKGAYMFGWNSITPTLYARGGGSYTGSGTVATTTATNVVTGTSTKFTNDYVIGDRITVGANTYTVTGVTNDTSLTISTNGAVIVSGSAHTVLPAMFKLVDSAATTRMFMSDTGLVSIGTQIPVSSFNVGTNNQFQVDANGNIVKINNVTTNFPSSQGAASTVLTNDGAGNLSWAASGGGGTIGGSIAVNQIAYGSGTNTIQGSANLTYDGTREVLTGSISTGNLLNLAATNSGTSTALNLALTNSSGTSHTGIGMTFASATASPTIIGVDMNINNGSSPTTVYGVRFTPAGVLSSMTTSYFLYQTDRRFASFIQGALLVEHDANFSDPQIWVRGSWAAGGTSTTTKPSVLIETSTVTPPASTGWNTAGTGLGINAISTFTGNLVDLQLNGVSHFSVDALGTTAVTQTTTSTSGVDLVTSTLTVNPGSASVQIYNAGFFKTLNTNAGAANLSGAELHGIRAQALAQSLATNTIGTVVGVESDTNGFCSGSSTLTITSMYGFRTQPILQTTGGTGSVTVTTYAGLYLTQFANSGGGTFTVTNNYGIYQADTAAKNFFAGIMGVGNAAPSATTAFIVPASTTGVSSLRIPHGSAPTSPVNGDIWTTTTAMFVRINGTTVQLGSGGGTIGGSITQGQVAFGAVTGNQIAGSSNFTWDTGSNALFIQAPGFTASSGIARINGTFTGSAGNHYMSGLTVTLDNAQTGGSNNSIDGILTNVTCTGSATSNNGVNGFRTIVSLPTGQNTGQVTLFNGSLTTSTGSTYTTVYGSSLTGSIDGTITNFLGHELAATIIGAISTAAVSYSDNLNTSGTGITVPAMRGFSSTAVVASTDTATEFTSFYTNAQLAGSATNFYGAYLSPTVGFTGSATNLYGVYIAPVNNGTVTNLYGIYQAGANVINQFEGQILSSVSPIGGTLNAAWFSGAWFAGGDSTTTRPLVLIEPSGTLSTNWNTAGTAFGINAAVTFAGDLTSFCVAGIPYFKVDALGTAIVSGFADMRAVDVSSAWTDGGSLPLQDNSLSVINTNSGVVSSFTLYMPPNPINGKQCIIISSGSVTSFTLDGNGNTVNDAPGTLIANRAVAFEFLAGIWYRLY